MSQPGPDVDDALRPLTARSVVLSVLLGAHPPLLPVRELVRVAEGFAISESSLRVALTRMVSAGDLERAGSTYGLSERLLERQRRQDYAIRPVTTSWDGTWEMVAVTATGRTAADRAELRARLTGLRLAELREGLWLRPANLSRPWPTDLDDQVERFVATPQSDPRDLARTLWDLDAWAASATQLVRLFETRGSPRDRFTVTAAIVRLLLRDPVLPDQLQAHHPWPADALRAAHRACQDEVVGLLEGRRAS